MTSSTPSSFPIQGQVEQISALQAQAANLWLSEHLPDRLTADRPHLSLTAKVWEVPVILTYPSVGSLGQVGTILIDPDTATVMSHTPVVEMKQAGQRLYEQYRDAVQANFS